MADILNMNILEALYNTYIYCGTVEHIYHGVTVPLLVLFIIAVYPISAPINM